MIFVTFNSRNFLKYMKYNQIFPYEGKFLGLPLVVPVQKKDVLLGVVYNDTSLWIPCQEIERDGWRLIVKKFESRDGEKKLNFNNFMEKREEHRISYMRYWFNPTFSDGDEIRNWHGQIEYQARSKDNNFDDKFEAYFDGLSLDLRRDGPKVHNFNAKISRVPVNREGERIELFYTDNPNFGKERDRNRFVLSVGEKINLSLGAFNAETMAKMSNDERPKEVTVAELHAASILPNMNTDNRHLDMTKTLTNILGVYRTGKSDDLAGFYQVAFGKY